MIKHYRLKQPMVGWAKGEQFIYEFEWNEWTRKKTGETFNYRTTIGDGEKATLLNMLRQQELTSILEPTSKEDKV